MHPYGIARNLTVCGSVFVVLSGCGGSGPLPAAPSQQIVPAQPQPIPQGTFTVSGVVSRAGSAQVVPLEGVHVEDSQRHVFVKTGNDGSYTIRDVGAGFAYFYFKKDGYRAYVSTFTLTGDTRLDIQLTQE